MAALTVGFVGGLVAACGDDGDDDGEGAGASTAASTGATTTGNPTTCEGDAWEVFACSLTESACSQQACCAAEGLASTPQCRENVRKVLDDQRDMAAIAGSAVDEAGAQVCLARYQAAHASFGCGDGWLDLYQLDSNCPELFADPVRGPAAPGDPCTLTRDCALVAGGETFCRPASPINPAVCAVLFEVADGEGCASTLDTLINCLPESWCEPSSMVCVAKGGAGAPCTMEIECDSQHYCDLQAGSCAVRAGEGEACTGTDCELDLGCDPQTNTCIAFQQVGEPCGVNLLCEAGGCIEGICRHGWVNQICYD
jgi:hypothetical protein